MTLEQAMIESPCRFHRPVNSAMPNVRSITSRTVNVNDIFELWSLPWHALQRSLADSFRADAPSGTGLKAAAPAGSSWLMRARLSAVQEAAQAHR